MGEIKLKPCPFCGYVAKVLPIDYEFFCICEKCGATTKYYETEEEAAAAWNNRAGQEDEGK